MIFILGQRVSICRYLLQVIYASHATLEGCDAKIMYLSPPCASRRPPLRHFPHFPPRKIFLAASAFKSWHLPLAGHEPDCSRAKNRFAINPLLLDESSLPKSHLRSRADAATAVAPVAMPSLARAHERTYSWPPSLHHFKNSTKVAGTSNESVEKSLSNIDDDPFSHFISPVIEEDGLFGEASWTAGIVEDDDDNASRSSRSAKFYEGVAKKWSRYVTQQHRYCYGEIDDSYSTEEDEEEECDSDDSLATVTFEQDPVDAFFDARRDYFDMSSPADDRLQIPSHHQDVSSRSSPRKSTITTHYRRHSWREPSDDLFTVPEETEASLGSLDDRFAHLNIGESHFKPDQQYQITERAPL